MDVHTALICVGVFVVSAIVVYLISVLGIREKTFEEAIEEQKRRSQQETVVQTKTDKTKKDKKNFKKWSRRSKEKGNEKYQEEEIQAKNVSREHVEIKPEPEIIPESDTESKPPKNKKRKMNILPKPILVKKEANLTSAILEDKPSRNSDSESQDSKEADKKLESIYKEVVPEPVCVKEEEEPPAVEECKTEEITVKSVNTDQAAKEMSPQAATVSKKKKPKQDQAENVVAGSGITGSKLLALLKNAIMSDEDVQMMIDFLLNKQGDISGWTKKNDPVTLLKKQLQDKEQALEDEQNKSQATLTKLRELRKEFNQEKSRFSSSEQALTEKMGQYQQEIQALHASIKTTRDQHQTEISSSQSKLQQTEAKLNEKSKTIIKLQDEKSRLESTMSSLETDKKKSSTEVSRLNTELKQIKDIKEQYQAKQADFESLQKTRDDYQQKNQKLEERLKQLSASHKKESESLQKQLLETQEKLKTVETNHSTITQELNDSKSASTDVERENSALRQRLQAVETVVKDREEELKKLEASLEEASVQRTELESRLEQLQSKLEELIKSRDKHINQGVMQVDNEHQFPLVGERTSAEGEEAPHHHQNGDLHLETNNKPVQKKVLEVSEHERIVKEKERVLERLHDEVNEHKSNISTLSEELEQQKRKNNELREKNWKAMEAVSTAEKAAELKVEQLRKESSEKLIQCQKEAELRVEEARKTGESRVEEEKTVKELLEAKEKAEEKLREVEQRLQEESKNKEVRSSEVQEELQQRLQVVQKSMNDKTQEINQTHEEYASKIEQHQKREQELLQRILPEIKIDQKLEHSVWITHYEQEAAKLLTTLKTSVTTNSKEDGSRTELNDLRNQLTLVVEERDKLDNQVQHYKTVLSETDGALSKLRNSVAEEEIVCRERLQTKEQELQKEYASKVGEQQKREQELLLRIFPEVKVDQMLEHSAWLSNFEQEAAKLLSTLKSNATTNLKEDSSRTELNELRNQLTLAIDERSKLDGQVQHYKTVLSETEDILNKLQNSVEAEEEVWRERLQAKEKELQKVSKSNEELIMQQKSLEASLLQLQGVEEATSEMQAKLKELQAKLQGEESEKKVLEQKFDEASNSALKLKEQIDLMSKEIEESKKDKEKLENLNKEIQQIKVQLDKERRITKDLSAQTVKLNSLVKIGQDALRAEQDTVKELQAQLQSVKSSNLNGPPPESTSIVESESEMPLINSEKTKPKKRDVSGKK